MYLLTEHDINIVLLTINRIISTTQVVSLKTLIIRIYTKTNNAVDSRYSVNNFEIINSGLIIERLFT